MKVCAVLLFFTLSVSAFCQKKVLVNTITAQELKLKNSTEQFLLLDVRTAKEYQEGHIKNAINLPIAKRKHFKNTAKANFNKQEPVIVYCYSGVRSKKAGKILLKLGFTEVYDFSGGWQKWSAINN
jgi:hydroxyacylglutathione hydrolase